MEPDVSIYGESLATKIRKVLGVVYVLKQG